MAENEIGCCAFERDVLLRGRTNRYADGVVCEETTAA